MMHRERRRLHFRRFRRQRWRALCRGRFQGRPPRREQIALRADDEEIVCLRRSACSPPEGVPIRAEQQAVGDVEPVGLPRGGRAKPHDVLVGGFETVLGKQVVQSGGRVLIRRSGRARGKGRDLAEVAARPPRVEAIPRKAERGFVAPAVVGQQLSNFTAGRFGHREITDI